MEAIIRESVKAMANIGEIKMVEVSGLRGISGTSVTLAGGGGTGIAGGSKSGGGNSGENVVSAAARNRAHQLYRESLVKEMGMNRGEISNSGNSGGE
jgi:hypothetical protein